MKSVVLRLEGPLQSWATQSKLGVRDTDREPSKSGVLGMVGAALGMDRADETTLAELRALEMAVRVDRTGSLLHDYHTAGGGAFRGEPYFVQGVKDCVPSHRYYLQDASFVVALGGDEDLVERIARALENPRWPIYLGRRACAPSVAPLIGVVDASPAEAATSASGPASDETRRPGRRKLLVECAPEDGGYPRYDVPLSFVSDGRRYAVRYVRVDWVELEATA